MYTRYRHAGSTIKIISLIGKKNTGKKTPKDDHELGYSDITLALTLNLPTAHKRTCNYPLCIKKLRYESGR